MAGECVTGRGSLFVMNITRRQFFSITAGAGAAMLGMPDDTPRHGSAKPSNVQGATPVDATPVATPTIATPVMTTDVRTVGEAETPVWRFVVHAFEDPYLGKLIFPSQVPDGNRVVRADVEIINASDQPLNFQTPNVHLLDADGIEYPAGNAQGTSPKIVSQVLNADARTRGSVWFVVPSAADLVEIKYFGPSPQLHVPLSRSFVDTIG